MIYLKPRTAVRFLCRRTGLKKAKKAHKRWHFNISVCWTSVLP